MLNRYLWPSQLESDGSQFEGQEVGSRGRQLCEGLTDEETNSAARGRDVTGAVSRRTEKCVVLG